VKSKAAIGATNPQKQKTELQWQRQLSKGEKQQSSLQTVKSKKQNCNCNWKSAKGKTTLQSLQQIVKSKKQRCNGDCKPSVAKSRQ